ncbi:MAG: hypothetical protein L3J59_07165 [Methylococcaceae bacterium]|nr:hypothetical protein [Methylococcaceae bacterium]
MQTITNEKQKISYISDQYKADIIQVFFKTAANTKYINLKYDELDLIDILYLSAFVRCAKDQDNDTVYEIDRVKKMLPIKNGPIFKHLIQKRLISISPEMPINSFTFDRNGKMIDFDLYGIHWSVHIDGGLPHKSHKEDLLKNKRESMDSPFNGEAKNLWKNITVDECIDYFLEKSSRFKLPVVISNPVHLRTLLADLVEYHSLAVCFEMIHGICDMSRIYFDKSNITDEKIMQKYLLTEFENGIQNILKKKTAQSITQRQLEPRKSMAIKLLFEDVFCFDYESDWFDYNMIENNLFEKTI